MKKIVRIGLAAAALGGSLLGGVQASEAAQSATALMNQSKSISIPGVNANVYLNGLGGGVDVTNVTSGTPPFDVLAFLDCDSGPDPLQFKANQTDAFNSDIFLTCNFLVTGLSTFGQLSP